eukprot:TRINITY_DN70995_c0_g1_i1.p1 TRINITY_DN70995_c0_g1~~TRINITY_DN70995_c0_g1_i1.p1  ORF type:complete len:771 (+),score=42.77 TRINITY_DN70995_c0_g1_i1:1465-3777(+)
MDITGNFYHYSVAEGCGLIILDVLIYLLLGLYLDNVLPGVGGVRRPLHFFLTKSYWFPNERSEVAVENNALIPTKETTEGEVFEPVDAGLKAQEDTGDCLTIKGMTKIYGDGKLAVNNVSLNIYKGQVFILLGHNGAGKTTSLSMLTGLLSPTKGSATINGINIFTELDRLRGMLGICPQESIFYDDLTVEQHIRIMSMLKGVNYDAESAILQGLLYELDMLHTLNNKARTLSGGEKRKLSLVLALIGKPQILMLDEPTSGLDATARQKVWAIVKRMKKDCIVLMTTHYMDEAEKLGDRIAIMADGEIKCCGSPLFLKNNYGTGYNLSLVKADESFQEELITGLISIHVPNYTKLSESRTEVVYRLPFEAVKQFPGLFSEIDRSSDKLGISSYGVAITSLEDVFLKVGANAKALQRKVEISMTKENPANEFLIENNAKHNVFTNLWTVLWTVWLVTIRTVQLLICEVVLPIFICCLAFMSIPYDPQYSYTYGSSALPTPQTVLFNSVTKHEESTEALRDFAPGYNFNVYDPIRSNSISTILEDVNSLPLTMDTSATSIIYVASYKPSELQVFVQGHAPWPHAPTLFANLVVNRYLQLALPESNVQIESTITPITYYNEIKGILGKILLVILFMICVIIAFSIPPSSVMYSIVKENTEGRKFYQLLNGLRLAEYWIGRFLADVVKFAPLIITVVIIASAISLEVTFGFIKAIIGQELQYCDCVQFDRMHSFQLRDWLHFQEWKYCLNSRHNCEHSHWDRGCSKSCIFHLFS